MIKIQSEFYAGQTEVQTFRFFWIYIELLPFTNSGNAVFSEGDSFFPEINITESN